MKGINFHIHGITMPHRKSSISLLKIDYDDYQSMYSKVNPKFIHLLPSVRKKGLSTSIPDEMEDKSFREKICNEDCEEFGIFNLIEDDSKDKDFSFPSPFSSPSSHLSLPSHTITVELYSDHNELELVCAGKIQIQHFHKIDPTHNYTSTTNLPTSILIKRNHYLNTDPIMNCCNFFFLSHISHNSQVTPWNLSKNQLAPSTIESTSLVDTNSSDQALPTDHILKVPLYYKTQGRYSIEAGFVLLSVRLYSIDLDKVRAQLYLSHTSPSSHHICWRCDGLFPKPPDIVEDEEEVADTTINTSFQSATTKEEEEDESSIDSALLRDEYDSIDEFIDRFMNNTLREPSPPPAPPLVQSVQSSVQFQLPPKKPKKKPVKRTTSSSVERRRKERDYVQENATFPKPRVPSRSKFERYLKFK